MFPEILEENTRTSKALVVEKGYGDRLPEVRVRPPEKSGGFARNITVG